LSEVKDLYKGKILILCVDRDNDLGVNTGIKTPVIGRESNLSAATNFAIVSPEDSDVNTMFSAIKLYDRLVRILGKENCEIACITGLPEEGIEADIKISKELDEVLRVFKADGVILVSDGVSDESVVPIITSKVPIISVSRVIVQQSQSVEEIYTIITRYIKRLTEDPSTRRILLGVPSIIIILYSIFYVMGFVNYFWVIAEFIVGIIGLIKAFQIDKALYESWENAHTIVVSAALSLILIVTGFYIGFLGITTYLSHVGNQNISNTVLVGIFITERLGQPFSSSDLIIAGLIILMLGRFITKFIKHAPGIMHGAWHEIVSISFLITLKFVIDTLGEILTQRTIFPSEILIPLILNRVALSFAITVLLTILFISYERVQRIRVSS
jgi:putative membrane protein